MAANPARTHLRLVSAHAADPVAAVTDQFAESELIIEICPRGYDWWRGTAAQIQAEGVLPEGFEWPVGSLEMCWNDGQFEYWLRRTHLDGRKVRVPSDHDLWAMRRAQIGEARNGWARALIYEKRCDLAYAIWRQTPAFNEHFCRYWAAHKDKDFQAFKNKIPGVAKPKRGRKSHG